MGVSHRIGSLMSYWVLTANGTVVSRMTLSRVTNIYAQTDENNASTTTLDKEIGECLKEVAHVIVERGKSEPKDWSKYTFYCNPYFKEEFNHVISNEEAAEDDDEFSPDVYGDTYIRMKLSLPQRG